MYDIITDVEKGISALVNPEFGVALGPIAMGEDAVSLLEQFAGMHGVDPSTVPTSVLHTRWDKFVTEINDVIHQGEEIADTIKPDVNTAPAGTTDTSLPTDLPQSAPGAPVPVPDVPVDQAEQPTADTAPAPTPDPETPAAPVTAPLAGNQICLTCDGFRTTAYGAQVIQCPTCVGTGEVLAARPEPTT